MYFMLDYEVNATFVTLGGHVDLQSHRFLYFVLMLAVYIIILCSNFIVIYLIRIHKNLHEPMYILIAALLVNSIFSSTTVYPKLLMDFLAEKQITYSSCLFQCFLYYSLNGSEFLLLSVMAYDRYVSICKPLQYHTIMTKTVVSVCLGFAWIVPACKITVPVAVGANAKLCSLTLKGILCNNSIYKLHCVTSRALSVYGVIVLINVTVLPVLFILFTYAKIFFITLQSCRKDRKKVAQTCLPHLLVLLNHTYLLAFDVIIVKLEFDFTNYVRLTMTLQVIVFHPLFNPIIYGLKMKEISKHIKRLFCQRKLRCSRFVTFF